jgi:hypothetical protein
MSMAVLKNLMQEREERERELNELREQLAKLKAAKPIKALSFKVGDKGGLSVYGMGRFPVTLYKEQWERLLDHKEVILEYIAENASRMKTRDEQ